jgi:hypothetical protein
MDNTRVWLFRVLVMLGTGLMLISWFIPWWRCEVEALNLKDAVVIYPYALYLDLGVKNYLQWAAMPDYFTPLMWTYLGLAIVALLIGAWFINKNVRLLGREFNLSRWLIGIVGFSYIVVVICAVAIAMMRAAEVDVPLLGRTFIAMSSMAVSWIEGFIELGFWLACAAGPLFIVLALLRNKIIGKAKIG